jgi:hypothetical protein
MAYVLKDGQGSLFKNENRTSDNHPNARGDLMIDGVLYEIAAWTKTGTKGPFQSLSVKRKEARQERPQASDQRREPPNSYGDRDDGGDIPF